MRASRYKSYSGTDYYGVKLPIDFTKNFPDLTELTLEESHSGAQITYTVVA